MDDIELHFGELGECAPAGRTAQRPRRDPQAGHAQRQCPQLEQGLIGRLVRVARHHGDGAVSGRRLSVDKGSDRRDDPVATRQVGVGEVGNPHTRHSPRRAGKQGFYDTTSG